MHRSIFEIARHELTVIVSTPRAIAVALLYVGLAILGGLIYVLAVRFSEQKLIELMVAQGADAAAAAENLDLAAEPTFKKLAGFFAGTEPDAMAASLRDSIILPVFFWCSLALLPFLVILTSFDQMASDLVARSTCYSILRARRAEILLGKIVAHASVFTVLTAISSTILVVLAAILLHKIDLGAALFGLLRVWLLLLPFGLCYLSLSAFFSVVTQPFAALILGIGATIFMRVLAFFSLIPADHNLGFLRLASFLSPAHYHEGLWLAGISEPLQSCLVYLLFSAVFVALAILQLRSRDL